MKRLELLHFVCEATEIFAFYNIIDHGYALQCALEHSLIEGPPALASYFIPDSDCSHISSNTLWWILKKKRKKQKKFLASFCAENKNSEIQCFKKLNNIKLEISRLVICVDSVFTKYLINNSLRCVAANTVCFFILFPFQLRLF